MEQVDGISDASRQTITTRFGSFHFLLFSTQKKQERLTLFTLDFFKIKLVSVVLLVQKR